MTSFSRACVIVIGVVSAPPVLGAEVEDFSRSVPLTYVLPARGLSRGRATTDVSFSAYTLYGSPSPSGDTSREESVLSTRLRFSISFTERLHLWMEPEVRRIRWSLGSGDETTETARADAWLGARLSPPLAESLVRLGIAGMVLVPAGRETAGRRGDFSSGVADYALIGLCDIDLSRFVGSGRCVVYLNVGYRWHRNETDGSRVWPDVYPAAIPGEGEGFNDQLLLRLGWSYTVSGLSLEAEARGDQFINAREWIRWRENPISLNAGLRKWLGKTLWVRLGGEVAFSSGDPGTPLIADPEVSFPDWIVVGSVGRVWGFL